MFLYDEELVKKLHSISKWKITPTNFLNGVYYNEA